jgi:hypothetical protein
LEKIAASTLISIRLSGGGDHFWVDIDVSLVMEPSELAEFKEIKSI